MEQGFWTAVEEFIGQHEVIARFPLAALREHLREKGFNLPDDYVVALLLEDTDAREPNLRWTVTKAPDGKLRFAPR
jgi:hypothetical protein